MRVLEAWQVKEAPGWTADYRIVARTARVIPVRVAGRWYRGPYFTLDVMYAEENPPTPWITVWKALTRDALMTRPVR